MISFLKGKIESKSENFIEIDVAGVGYKVFMAFKDLNRLKSGQTLKVFIYQQVKENGIDLYGFWEQAGREFFEILIGISGIGPKTALQVLEKVNLTDLQESLIKDSPEILTTVSGIGAKTAERIILELKGKKKFLQFSEANIDPVQASGSEDIEVIQAMENLGYQLKDVQAALKRLDPKVAGTENKI